MCSYGLIFLIVKIWMYFVLVILNYDWEFYCYGVIRCIDELIVLVEVFFM